jgi:L-fuconolactonase
LASASFIGGVKLLSTFGFHFEITVNYLQVDAVIEFMDRVGDVRMVLDHCGKTGFRAGEIVRYERDINALARYPNLFCKLSGLATEADYAHWTQSDLQPYIEATLDAFGPKRLLYGSDWPVCLQATSIKRWVNVLDMALSGASPDDIGCIYRENANRFYRLGLDTPAH